MSSVLAPPLPRPGKTRARTSVALRPTSGPARPVRSAAPAPQIALPETLGLGQLFVHSRDAIIVADVASGRIVAWNPAAEALFGYSCAEAIGQLLDMVIPPAIARVHLEAIAHSQRSDQGALVTSQRPMEVPALTKSGDEVNVELSLIALDQRAGQRRYVMAMLRDVSARRRAEMQSFELSRAELARADAEEKLQQHDRLLSRGLNELTRPLERLHCSATRLARLANESDCARVVKLARVVEARAETVHGKMRQLADTAAIQASNLELQPERLNIVPVVNRVASEARRRSSAHKINVAVPQGLTVLVDASRFEQVVASLVDQAIRRNPRGCWIDVDLRRPLVGLARLEVRDYGRPVSDDEQREMLEANPPENGLAVNRWIIEQHGGTFSLESPEEGGLRVIVTLPTQRGRVLGS